MIRYNDFNGNEIILSDKLDQGGEAEIYTIAGHNNLLAKIYNKKNLIDNQKLQKLQRMCAMYDNQIAKYYAWPQQIIYSGKKPVGFIMENINSNNRNGSEYIKFLKFYNWSYRREYFPNADYKFLLSAAKNLTISIEFLHSKGIVIGDINESNIFVNNTDATIKLIDCDSYQIDNFLCGVGKPEYTAPELPDKLRGEIRTINHDYFSLAILIFLILVGKHPYTGINAPIIRQSIVNGLYCYGENAEKKNISSLSPYIEVYESLNDEIKGLFDEAFSVNIRPNTKIWRKALEKYKRQLKPCPNDEHHYYNPKYKSCVWCDIKENGFKAFSPLPIQQQNSDYNYSYSYHQNTCQTATQSNYQQSTYNTNGTAISFSGNKYRHNSEISPKIIIFVLIVLAVLMSFVFRHNTNNDYQQEQNTSINQNVSTPVNTYTDTVEDVDSLQETETENSDDTENQPQTETPSEPQSETPPEPQTDGQQQTQPTQKQTKIDYGQNSKNNKYILQTADTITPVSKEVPTEESTKTEIPVPELPETKQKYKYDMKKSVDAFYKGAD